MSVQEKRKIIETLFNSNITRGAEITKRTGIAKTTVYRVLAKLKSVSSIERKNGSEKQRKMGTNDGRALVNLALYNKKF